MTILSKKKANAPKDRTREGGAGPEVDVHHGVVQNDHSSGSIALPNSPYQVRDGTRFPDFALSLCLKEQILKQKFCQLAD